MTAFDDSSDALVGRRLGEFVVREHLSSGGFGAVFRAEQPALAREAVIKVMHTSLRASESLIARFLLEARLASRLDHPFAAHIYAFGAEPDGVLWIAMELVRGTPLDKLLEAQGPIPLERFVPLLERICQVVQTAHEQGIVHRDLKPANVMVLARAGQLLPKLLDLGIAKLAADVPGESRPKATAHDGEDDREAFAETVTPNPHSSSEGRLTEEGAIMGSPLYMAPEQWTDAGDVDERTDIYALGVLSYEALTGKVPFPGANRYAIAMAHAQQPPPALGGEFSPNLDAVLARAMAKRPAARFATALELAAAFRAASGIADEPAGIPRLSDELRVAVIARAPQPLAQAAGALEAARNAHQARDAVWQLVRVAVRLIAVIALSAHAHVGGQAGRAGGQGGGKTGDSGITDAVRRLRRRALPDAEWLALARDLAQPFAKMRDAYPVPELIDLVLGGAAPITELLALRDGADGNAGDEQVRDLLAIALPLAEKMLLALRFLETYRLVVPSGDDAQLWMGVRRSDPARLALRSRRLVDGQPALADATGLPVISLWPFVQVHEPAQGVGPRLMFFEGKGRRGARLVALPESFEHDDETLWEVVGGLVGDPADAGKASMEEERPFPGLAAFTAADSSRFFGRERETEELVNRLRAQSLLAIVGPSGAGKSSFVQAGIVPNLPEGWEVVTLRPGAAPLVSLTARLAQLGFDPAVLRAEIQAHAGGLGTMLRTRGKGTVVIVVDQLEELFTLCEDDAERQLFAETLMRAARSPEDPVRVILTLRDDFLLHAERIPALRSRLAPALHLLTTPGRDDLLRILGEPLRRAGYELDDPALAGEMVDALASARSALALLSFTASKLWELRDRRFRQITRKAYTSLGGVGGALARHAEATLDAMLPDEQRLVREVFRHAVTSEGTRAVLGRDELDQLLGDRGAPVIEKLVGARLLVSSDGAGGAEQIEITHEALIEAWPRLVDWRRQDAEGARLRDQLRAAARQWEERSRPTGLLWRGDALAEYRLWRSRYPGALTDVEVAFGGASVDASARAGRRFRVGIAVAFALLAGGIVLLLVLNARVADQRALAVDSAQAATRSAADLHDHLRAQYEDQGRRRVVDGDYGRALAYLDEARKLGATGAAHELLLAFAARGLTGKLVQVAHDDPIVAARFSPDGRLMITAGRDKRARIWDVATGKLVVEIVHASPVNAAGFTPDGARVLTAAEDGTATAWDAVTGKRAVVFDPGASNLQLRAIVASGDGRFVATMSLDDGVWLWDATTGKLVFALRPRGKAEGFQIGKPCAFSPDGARLAIGDATGALQIFDTKTGKLVASASHRARINSVTFSADGMRVATASDDHTAVAWDAATGRVLATAHHDAPVNDGAFSPDGTLLATAANDKLAAVWDVATGQRRLVLAGHLAGVNAIAFSPDGERIATASDDAIVAVWDAHTGRRESRLLGHGGAVFDLQFDRAGAHLATASIDSTAIVWSTAAQQPATVLLGHSGLVVSATFSADERRVVTAGVDGTARVWERESGREILSLPHGKPVERAELSPGDRQIATGDEGGTVRIWDARTGHLVSSLAQGSEIFDLAWRSADSVLIATDGGTSSIWKIAEPRASTLFETPNHERVGSIDFTASTQRIATTSNDRVLRIFDSGGAAVAQWTAAADRARFDPSGTRLVASDDRIAHVWTTDGTPVANLSGHEGTVLDARWSPDGKLIATASIDTTVRIWDARTGDELARLGDGRSQWWSARFSPSGRFLVTASSNGVVIWELPPSIGQGLELLRCREFNLVENHLIATLRPKNCT